MGARQDGQVPHVRSQASTQTTWKLWPQRGSTRTLSPSVNSARHIAHSNGDEHAAAVDDDDEDFGEASAAAKETVGSASMAFFLRPFGDWLAEEEELERRGRHAHRETSARPRMQTRAQSRDAKMTAMSESTAIAGAGCWCSGRGGGSGEGDGDCLLGPAVTSLARCRRLAEERMVLRLGALNGADACV
uniref:Uncharacterized protein n=1 Tax=Hordeum vulgare subsp. vulgare TaxID=112509 RepID=A0A8I6YT95_HORVV